MPGIWDYMGSTELIANLFRISQTEEKLRKDEIPGVKAATAAHYKVGKEVRGAIEKIGGTMPERTHYYRNKRLGEFLKELDLSEGKSTGIPTIQEELRNNGSPKAKFFTDADRWAVTVEIPIHPDFMEEKVDIEAKKVDIGTEKVDIEQLKIQYAERLRMQGANKTTF